MKIIVDQNIPLAQEFFSHLGEVIALPGRDLKSSDLNGADILLVRSITQVNESLLSGSNIQFVGSCTIGIDHLDTEYLEKNNIVWANAPGCNANAVVQYVFSAMAALRPKWQQQTIGIVGCGNIGRRLYQRLCRLACDVVVYDPFLESAPPADIDPAHLVSFNEVLDADIITCHTPLTHSGPFPTFHLFDRDVLSQLSDKTLLINSGRGAVIDNEALYSELESRKLTQRSLSIALDVWENEPTINRQLLEKVDLGTFHIAGYSVEGKEQGTYRVYQALCQFLDKPVAQEKALLLSQDKKTLGLGQAKQASLNDLILACYNILDDDKQLRGDPRFDLLRKQYISRREYAHFELPSSAQALQQSFDIIKGKS